MCLAIPPDHSLQQFQKKWIICLDYPEFSSGIRLCGLLQLQLILSCGWIRVAAVSSPGGWIQVTAESILRLTRVPVAGYGLQLTPYHGWLEFPQLDMSYRWFHPVANYNLRLILFSGWLGPAGLTRVAADLFFNISSNFKNLFCKIHHFYGLFSTDWFQLPLIQVNGCCFKSLEEAWESLKKLQEASSP